ncbi:GNAT family N-acetyltransferase [Thalassiella azotivora]
MRIDVVECGPGADGWVDRWFDRWYAALDAAQVHGLTDPIRVMAPDLRVSCTRRLESERRVLLSAVEGEQVVGTGRVDLPRRDNTETAFVELYVPPAARRRGVGRALLGAAREVATAEGRTRFMTEVARPDDVDRDAWPGTAFLSACGFSLGLVNVRRDLPLPADAAVLRALDAEATAASRGYVVRTWHGRTPPEDRARMADLMARMSTDAPLGDLEYEPESWDAGRVAEFEEHQEAMGRRWCAAVAVAGDGTWAGYTYLGWTPSEPDRLHQWDTLVLREHRGRRLGLALKLAALRAATGTWPRARVVTTWNAASNAPMIAVNEAMGFRAVALDEEWQAGFGELVGVDPLAATAAPA